MALVSISEAIRLSGVSRATFYRTYINKGLISVTKDSTGKKKIDTSELLRVFGKLDMNTSIQPDNTQTIQSGQGKTSYNQVHSEDAPPYLTAKPDNAAELEHLKKQLQDAKENEQRLRDEFLDREQWYRQQIEKQDDKIKLLEHHQLEQKVSSKWWHWWR